MINESTQFVDESGKPIVDGYIYIGVVGQDPKLNSTPIYSDRELSAELSNPQRTDSFGRTNNKIWIPGRYSLKVEDDQNNQKLQDLDRGDDLEATTISLVNVQGVDTVTADAVPAVTSYVDKATYVLTVVSANTGAVTLAFGGGAKSVTKNGSDALIANDWPADSIQRVIWNQSADRFELQTQSTSEIVADLALKAPLSSPAFTDAPTAPTPAADDDSTKIATTEFVNDYVDSLFVESPTYSIVSGGLVSWTHGLGVEPFTVQAILECITADKGHAVGKKLVVGTSNMTTTSSTQNTGVALTFDSTEVLARMGDDGTAFWALRGDNGERGELNNARWELYLRASLV